MVNQRYGRLLAIADRSLTRYPSCWPACFTVNSQCLVDSATPDDMAVRRSDDPRVRLVAEAGRSYVKRTRSEYDVIDVALTDPQRTIVSGAYSQIGPA